jgi:hypothetical protein
MSFTTRRILGVTVAFASIVTLAACSSDSDSSTTDAPTTEANTTLAPLPLATYTVRPGAHQIAVIDAEPGTDLQIQAEDGTIAAEGTTDEQGSFLARNLEVGLYKVVNADLSAASAEVVVYDATFIPDQSFYSDQELPAPGFGYLTARDGTTLSINVMFPGKVEDGPYPTVVEYSGYSPSNPDDTTFGQLFTTLGYAYVAVNMRGTGCSGGSFRYFEESQSLDGYDAIEAIAAQPWVQDNEVGMVGISYPGISQLFVAATQPPSLAAITPLSVIDDSARSTLRPGGILNTGFAVKWTKERMDSAAIYGQEWSKKMADSGDKECADNQKLRLQNPDLISEINDNVFYEPEVGDIINPSMFVDKINVPVFLSGAWQDEQTGGHFPAFIDKFTGTPHMYTTLVNGLHTESLGPAVFPRYAEFLSLYVAKKTPDLTAAGLIATVLTPGIFGVVTPIVQENRFAGMTFEEALEIFESEPSVRILFEEGAADGQAPGTPLNRWRADFSAWPIPEAQAVRFNLGDNGTLGSDVAQTSSTDYTADPTATPETFFGGEGSIWDANIKWNWVRNPEGTAAVFTTAALTEDTVIIGPGSADLWISTEAADTDLEVTISEIRPDGSETYVQSGWLRASLRALNESASTELRPVHDFFESDVMSVTPGEPFLARVEIFPVAHPFRAGSKIRITIDTPGGNRGEWKFATLNAGEKVTILHDAEHPSSIALSIVPGLNVPAGVAACGSLRGQPCRQQ